MTSEEAIKLLKEFALRVKPFYEPQRTEYPQAIHMAIEALQRDIPKNPIVNYVADSDGARRLNDVWTEDSYLCPVCHTYFGDVFDKGYCRKCEQKLIQKRIRVIEK